MARLITAPRGTRDILPNQMTRWRYLEKTLLQVAGRFGFREIRVPTFEHTELFCRSVGDTTDVVNKEMYTFEDKGGRSITLRPEGTAGLCRAAIQNGLLGEVLPVRLTYILSCFRYEKPQSGRFREFTQFGVEMYGSALATADCEIIALAYQALRALGLETIELEINSIGCKECRPFYHQILQEYFENKRQALCPTCLDRLEKNPLRILDCKNPACSQIASGAPQVLDYLCEGCEQHFDNVKSLLTAAGIPFSVNSEIVRGLDYYTRTVFELIYTDSHDKRLVCGGGGRYGGLLEQLGGPDMEGIGFAMGLDRLISVLETEGCSFPAEKGCELYFASIGPQAQQQAFQLACTLRQAGLAVQCNLMERSLKAQMRYADKIGAKYLCILGEDELNKGESLLKNMATGETISLPLDQSTPQVIVDRIALNRLTP